MPNAVKIVEKLKKFNQIQSDNEADDEVENKKIQEIKMSKDHLKGESQEAS